MSLAEIREQLANRLADVAGARAKYYALPESPPAPLPAIITTWSTRPVRERFGTAPAGMRNREHTLNTVVVLSVRTTLPAEDTAGMAMAEKIMDSFEDNGRLDETASRCDLTQVEPFVLQYGEAQQGQAYYALRCNFTIREART